MSNREHAELRRALGAYALGALEPAERSEVEDHLEGCQACRDELASLAALPGLLARLSEDEVSQDLLEVPAGTADRLVAAAAEDRRAERRRVTVWRSVAAVAAALVLALGVVLIEPLGGPSGAMYAAQGTGVDATATVVPRDWGMQVRLKVQDLPDARGYTIWAVADDGHRAYVASWADVDRDAIELVGSCYMAAGEVTHLEISDDDDRVVAVLDA